MIIDHRWAPYLSEQKVSFPMTVKGCSKYLIFSCMCLRKEEEKLHSMLKGKWWQCGGSVKTKKLLLLTTIKISSPPLQVTYLKRPFAEFREGSQWSESDHSQNIYGAEVVEALASIGDLIQTIQARWNTVSRLQGILVLVGRQEKKEVLEKTRTHVL